VVVNPKFIWKSEELEEDSEVCLSIPGLEVPVFRPSEVRIKYQTLEGIEQEETMAGIKARIFQHEMDHLEGIVMTDRVEQWKQTGEYY